jgi:hypothetical protein
MIAYLQGKIIHKSEQQIILQTGDPSAIRFPFPNVWVIKSRPQNRIWSYLFIQKFARTKSAYSASPLWLNWISFKLLITVNGIGPKIAQEVLNQEISATQNAILQGNTLYLKQNSLASAKSPPNAWFWN